VDGELRLQTAEGLAVFHLGAAAEKWCEKILHPKSRIEKLGVKPGAKVSLLGDFAPDFLDELGKLTQVREQEQSCTRFRMHLFRYGFEGRPRCFAENLQINERRRPRFGSSIPKAKSTSPKTMFSAAGRKAGLKDVKVVGFSAAHTALKFVIPAFSKIGTRSSLPGNPQQFQVSPSRFHVYHGRMSGLLEVRGLTVELPTAAGWVRPVNEVSLRIAAGEALGPGRGIRQRQNNVVAGR